MNMQTNNDLSDLMVQADIHAVRRLKNASAFDWQGLSVATGHNVQKSYLPGQRWGWRPVRQIEALAHVFGVPMEAIAEVGEIKTRREVRGLGPKNAAKIRRLAKLETSSEKPAPETATGHTPEPTPVHRPEPAPMAPPEPQLSLVGWGPGGDFAPVWEALRRLEAEHRERMAQDDRAALVFDEMQKALAEYREAIAPGRHLTHAEALEEIRAMRSDAAIVRAIRGAQ